MDDADSGSLIYVDRHLVHEVTSPQVCQRGGERERNVWVVFQTPLMGIWGGDLLTCWEE